MKVKMPTKMKMQQKPKTNNVEVKFKSNISGVMREIAGWGHYPIQQTLGVQSEELREGKPMDIHEESGSDEKMSQRK